MPLLPAESLLHHKMGRSPSIGQVAQRGDRCPIPGNIQSQVGQGSEQPDLVEDVPAHGRTRWSLKVPSNPNHSTSLWFYDLHLYQIVIDVFLPSFPSLLWRNERNTRAPPVQEETERKQTHCRSCSLAISECLRLNNMCISLHHSPRTAWEQAGATCPGE